jgi:hypothetical protein
LANDLSRSLDKRDEKIERATADLNRLTVPHEQSFGRT